MPGQILLFSCLLSKKSTQFVHCDSRNNTDHDNASFFSQLFERWDRCDSGQEKTGISHDFSVSPSPLGTNLGFELGWTGLG